VRNNHGEGKGRRKTGEKGKREERGENGPHLSLSHPSCAPVVNGGGSVRENVCNLSKNVWSCFFGFSKKNVKM